MTVNRFLFEFQMDVVGIDGWQVFGRRYRSVVKHSRILEVMAEVRPFATDPNDFRPLDYERKACGFSIGYGYQDLSPADQWRIDTAYEWSFPLWAPMLASGVYLAVGAIRRRISAIAAHGPSAEFHQDKVSGQA
jgi:hypothetical protein